MMLSKGPSRPGSLRPNVTQHPVISIIVSLCSALLVVVTLVLVWAYCMPNGMSTRAALNHPGLWTSRSTAAMVERAPIVSNMTQLQAAAALLDPVMMMHAPKTYDKRYKNPCWTAGGGMAVGQAAQILIMCLPYVYVSGYFTGIGSLIDKLNAHPNVVKDAGPFSPWGSDWGMWSEYRSNFPQWLSDIHSGGSTVAALDHWPKTNIIIDGARGTSSLYWAASGKVHTAFSSTAVAAWKECHDQFNKDVVKYEQCMEDVALSKGRAADYNRSALAGLNYTEDQHLPLLMRALYGPLPPRLVVMVRNPVKRMYSNYFGRKNYHERYGNTSVGFTKFVDEQLAAWKACVEGDTLHGMNGMGGPPVRHTDADCYLRMESLSMREEKVFYHCDQLFRGLYAPYLRLWMRFLPRKHILVLRSSDYFAKPDLVTNQVLAFLGLPLLPGHPGIPKYLPGVPYMPLLGQQQLDSADAAHVRMAGAPRSTTKGVEPMAEGTRMALLAYYKPYNEQLAQLLDDPSILNWNTDPDAE